MDKGIYTALSGGLAQSRELELIANNLANVNTTGFKRDSATFNEYLTQLRNPDSVNGLPREVMSASNLQARPQHDKSFVEVDGVYTDFAQGHLQRTNRPLDVGIEGEGFFEVLTPDGPRFTRQGNFNINEQGILVNNQGFPVLSQDNGEPPIGRIIRIGRGTIVISQEGTIRQNNQVIATLGVREFQEKQWLEKIGNSLYRNTNEMNLVRTKAQKSQVQQGFLEGSNVNPVKEMTRLIQATRSYEAQLQAIKTYQEIDLKSVQEIMR